MTSKLAKVLTGKGRGQIKEKNFALPGRRYPIHDAAHARNALARIAQHGTPAEQKVVKAKVEKKYPGIEQEEKPMDAKRKQAVLQKVAMEDYKVSKGQGYWHLARGLKYEGGLDKLKKEIKSVTGSSVIHPDQVFGYTPEGGLRLVSGRGAEKPKAAPREYAYDFKPMTIRGKPPKVTNYEFEPMTITGKAPKTDDVQGQVVRGTARTEAEFAAQEAAKQRTRQALNKRFQLDRLMGNDESRLFGDKTPAGVVKAPEAKAPEAAPAKTPAGVVKAPETGPTPAGKALGVNRVETVPGMAALQARFAKEREEALAAGKKNREAERIKMQVDRVAAEALGTGKAPPKVVQPPAQPPRAFVETNKE